MPGAFSLLAKTLANLVELVVVGTDFWRRHEMCLQGEAARAMRLLMLLVD